MGARLPVVGWGASGSSAVSSRVSGVSGGRCDGGGACLTPLLRTPARVHCDRVGRGRRVAPPSGGGRIGGAAVLFPPRASVPWASRGYYGGPTVLRPISTTPRVPELVQVATRHPPLRGFPRGGGASWMPTSCLFPLYRTRHTRLKRDSSHPQVIVSGPLTGLAVFRRPA